MFCLGCGRDCSDGLKVCDNENCNSTLLVEDFVIKNIVVKNLFNAHDYTIDFTNDKNVSILIAPNGFGKSTIFKFIDFIYNPTIEALEKFLKIPFESFTINFTNGCYAMLEKNKEDVDVIELKKYNFSITRNIYKNLNEKKINIFEDLVKPRLSNMSFKEIYSMVSSEIKNIFNNTQQEIYPLKGLYLNLRRLEIKESTKEQLDAILRNKKKSKLISEHFEVDEFISNIDYATNISIFNLIVKEFLQKESRAKVLVKSINKLNNDPHLRIVEEGWAEMQYKKEMLDLFCKIYNERNKQSGKNISYNLKDGFLIKNKSNVIPLESLSDGEKNDFCIFYHLIFSTKPLVPVTRRKSNRYSLLIIDEPEVSLHIEWQKTWLDYILQICENKKVQVIIATHSPYIVNANFDLYADKKVKKHVKTTKD